MTVILAHGKLNIDSEHASGMRTAHLSTGAYLRGGGTPPCDLSNAFHVTPPELDRQMPVKT